MKRLTWSNKVKAGVIAGAMALSVFGAYSAFTSVTDTKVNTFNIVAGEDGAFYPTMTLFFSHYQ